MGGAIQISVVLLLMLTDASAIGSLYVLSSTFTMQIGDSDTQLLVLAVRSLSRTAYSTFKQQTDSFTVQVSRNKLFQKT